MKVGVGSDHGSFAMKQGVEDDNLNVLCFGGRTTGIAVAWECNAKLP